MTRHLVPDHVPDPTVDDLRCSVHGGAVTWADDVEHPVWRDTPVAGRIHRHPGRPGWWVWTNEDGPGCGRADTRHQALEELLADVLGPYVREGDVADHNRGSR